MSTPRFKQLQGEIVELSKRLNDARRELQRECTHQLPSGKSAWLFSIPSHDEATCFLCGKGSHDDD